MFGVYFTRSARKEIDALEDKYRDKVARVIDSLACDPFQGKKLQGEFDGRYSIRAWPFRIIYEIRKKQVCIIVLSLKNRKDAYR
ncbi:type II toxin-antitoxin system mRNA interferase toxin, RelE/StbE family [Candidatus Kaiserbacteria bacterium]|nr:type II toxin-antitoxin system mRNA interferase toxin, RelE/StbE family [Candidatus Kaiserbacteria bacterium]